MFAFCHICFCQSGIALSQKFLCDFFCVSMILSCSASHLNWVAFVFLAFWNGLLFIWFFFLTFSTSSDDFVNHWAQGTLLDVALFFQFVLMLRCEQGRAAELLISSVTYFLIIMQRILPPVRSPDKVPRPCSHHSTDRN